MSQYYSFFMYFDQINTALMSIRESKKKQGELLLGLWYRPNVT